MNIVTKTAGVVLAATALCGIGASAAFAATPTGHAAHAAAGTSSTSSHPSSQVGAPQYSRGFHVYNLTSVPWELNSITGSYEGTPQLGSWLQPGQYDDFEASLGSQDTIAFNTNNGSGVMVELDVDIFGDTSSSVVSEGGPDHADTNGQTINLLEPAGTVINYDGSQAQQQANALNELCAVDADAACTFTPTNETRFAGTQHQVGDAFTNASTVTATYTLTEKDTVGSTDSVNVKVSAGTKLFDMVDYSISASYGHTWTTSHEFDESMTATVPPKTKVWLDDAPQMIRYTGNFTITLGNTTINLTGVYFDSPDPDGNGVWTLMSQSLNGGPIHATALH